MANRRTVFQYLLESRNLAADDALLSCLDQLEPELQDQAVEVLLHRQQAHALPQLVATYSHLPEACKASITARAPVLEASMRAVLNSGDDATRQNIIEIIAVSRSYFMAYMLSDLLRSTSPKIRSQAANALRALVEDYRQARSTIAAGARAAMNPGATYTKLHEQDAHKPFLLAALADALKSYDGHFRMTAIEAVLSMSLELEHQLLAEIRHPLSKSWKAMTDQLNNQPPAVMATFALQVLRSEKSAPQAAKILSCCRHAPFMIALLESAWLLGDPAIAEGCRGVLSLEWLQSEPRCPLLDLDPAQFRRAVRLISASGIAPDMRLAWYRVVLLSDRRDLHPSALAAVIAIRNDASSELLRMLLDWTEPALARLAHRELHQRFPREQLPSRPAPAPDQRRKSARCAQAAEAMEGFAAYWQAFDSLKEEVRTEVGRRIVHEDSAALSAIGEALRSAESPHRLRSIQIIRCTGLAQRFAGELVSCSRDPDRIVRSAAVKALGQLAGDISRRLLLVALNDVDRRVRANAIEALAHCTSSHVMEELKTKLVDPDHRVRAAAIHALLKLKVKDAAEGLLKLLNDPAQAHRISALWLVEKLKLYSILGRIKKLAREDPDEAVRLRARRIMRQARRRRLRRNVAIPPPRKEAAS